MRPRATASGSLEPYGWQASRLSLAFLLGRVRAKRCPTLRGHWSDWSPSQIREEVATSPAYPTTRLSSPSQSTLVL